jgi:biotin carboxylase
VAHILFVGVTRWSQDRCARAVALGHRVSVITGDPRGSAVARIHAAGPVDAVLVQDETVIEPTATACARLGIPFTAAAGVHNARDKARTRQVLDAAGLASVPYARVPDAAAAVAAARRIGYPVVVKPIRGADSVLTSTAGNPAAVRAAAARIARHRPGAILVERYLRGRLVWLDIARGAGPSRLVGVFDRCATETDECRDIGAVLPSGAGPRDVARCFGYAENVCDALGLDLGLFHLDLALTAGGPVLIEANPRMMGGVLPLLYRFATGVDIADVAIPAYLGRAPAGSTPVPAPAAVRKVIARRGGRIAASVDPVAVARDAGAHEFINDALRPGRRLRCGQLAAVILTRGAGGAGAAAAADAVIERLAQATGVELVRAAQGA